MNTTDELKKACDRFYQVLSDLIGDDEAKRKKMAITIDSISNSLEVSRVLIDNASKDNNNATSDHNKADRVISMATRMMQLDRSSFKPAQPRLWSSKNSQSNEDIQINDDIQVNDVILPLTYEEFKKERLLGKYEVPNSTSLSNDVYRSLLVPYLRTVNVQDTVADILILSIATDYTVCTYLLMFPKPEAMETLDMSRKLIEGNLRHCLDLWKKK